MRTLLLATVLAAAAATHPGSSVPPAQVPNAQVPTAQRGKAIPSGIVVKPVTVGDLTFTLPISWTVEGNRFSPPGVPGVSVTVSDPTAISSDFRSWFAKKAADLQKGNALVESPVIETPKQGFSLSQTSNGTTFFAAADLGDGQVQTITYEAPSQAAFANYKGYVDAMMTSMTR